MLFSIRGDATADMEVTHTPVLHNRSEGGVGYFNYGNFKNDKLDALAAASSKEPDPAQARAAYQSRPALARRAGAPRSTAPPDDPLGHA